MNDEYEAYGTEKYGKENFSVFCTMYTVKKCIDGKLFQCPLQKGNICFQQGKFLAY